MQRFITCTLCENIFNLFNREPMMLLCCGKTACRQCLEDMSPTDKEKGADQEFECKFCKAKRFEGAKVVE